MKSKPTMDELLAAYDAYGQEVGRASRERGLTRVLVRPMGRRRVVRWHLSAVVASAAAMLLLMVLPSGRSYAMSPHADRAAAVEMVEHMLNNLYL